jgi:hypothetical protein
MIFGVLLLATANVVCAQMGSTFVIGVGQNSCGQLVAAIGDVRPGYHFAMDTGREGIFVNEYVRYQEWLMGFVSGYNATHTSPDEVDQQKQIRGIEQAGMDLWMRNWCNQHRTEKVSQGAAAFVNEMRNNAN